MAYAPGALVAVRFNNTAWFNAVVVEHKANDWVTIDLDVPLPKMSACGLSHKRVNATLTDMPARNLVSAVPCFMTDPADHHIKIRP